VLRVKSGLLVQFLADLQQPLLVQNRLLVQLLVVLQ